MRTLLTLSLCLFAYVCLAQFTVDRTLTSRYNAAFARLPKEFRDNLNRLMSDTANHNDVIRDLAVHTKDVIDTLNKKDAPDYSHLNAFELDTNPKTGRATKHYFGTYKKPAESIHPNFCSAELRGDTLIITSGFMFPYVVHKIVNGKVTSVYQVYQKGDLIYSLDLKQKPTSELDIPMSAVLKLSTFKFKTGQTLYGQVSYATRGYYTQNSAFKHNYMHSRLWGTYVFKAMIMPPRN
ncbi:hypothetical protein [Mucilaginibacter myungsuensis]|uniref:Uncharacterized protein n=1 Tax=Mucilaginibacter myungsuensis TaxID=649104 RepID=A0A929KUS2_9SPHI|nr:hypothetical protein [Mucilaginibacter myungsuensis]MBE9660278.1 hypothetical protein [Mucilaginibacter myungsuensis]MDN3600320.1 hypothetical protein [Mucilaginibacter myungsuensis]